MTSETNRSMIYFDAQLHQTLRIKAAQSHCSISGLVNDAVKAALADDAEDLAAFDERMAEPTSSYEALLEDLKARGKL